MLKINAKAFWPIVFGLASAVGYAIDHKLVPAELAGYAAMAVALLNGLLQQAQKAGTVEAELVSDDKP